MVKKLLVEIGGDRFSVEVAAVNDPTRPTEIETSAPPAPPSLPPSPFLLLVG